MRNFAFTGMLAALSVYVSACGGGGGGGGGTNPPAQKSCIPACNTYQACNTTQGVCEDKTLTTEQSHAIVNEFFTGGGAYTLQEWFEGTTSIMPDNYPPNTGVKVFIDGLFTRDRSGVPDRIDAYVDIGCSQNSSQKSASISANGDSGNPTKIYCLTDDRYTFLVSELAFQYSSMALK